MGRINDAVKGIVINYSFGKFATVCITTGAYIRSSAVVVFTKASKIVNVSKSLHSSPSFYFECI